MHIAEDSSACILIKEMLPDKWWGERRQNLQSKKRTVQEKQLILGCMCGHFGAQMGLRWGPQRSGMVDMLIPNRFEIGFSKEMVCGVIFGVKYQILPE